MKDSSKQTDPSLFQSTVKTRYGLLVYFAVLFSSVISFTDVKASGHEPIDQLLRNEWWPKALKLNEVWGQATGKGVTIAACDTGIHKNAKDLEQNLLIKYARDFANPRDKFNIFDGNYVSQGTASAGIMVGIKNFQGINGIAYNARLVPLQNYHYNDQLDSVPLSTSTERCIKYALTISDVAIIAVQALSSEGSIESNPKVRQAIELAIKSGVIVVSPAGDSTKELYQERIYDSGSIIVGALAQNGRTAIFSNYGSRVTISSFGEKIKALWGKYGETKYFAGTLAASAQIAAFVALAKEINPQLLPADMKWLLKTTRSKQTFNYNVGGIIDPVRFIKSVKNYKSDAANWRKASDFRKEATRKIKGESWMK